ncbi:MAG TPA: exopolysaccharide biosynthesis polyprenyl glycosylphosphotransferase [Gaiellaceae bacterium]|jgi:exopolysaccharide biosynthesis polyprenyl glycosylphosphotransferase|nr:exopolysaccharide biosynthesis polyprenyl glycosylphosphotransferase [Gaiellaceae bacterium]
MAVAEEMPPPEDERAARPYLLRRSPLETFARRAVSVLVLAAIDVAGLTVGLYAAILLRALVRDPTPVRWHALWEQENDWLAFLILLMLLVFWRNRLYGPRELREGAGKIVSSVVLVAALALAFAIGTSQHFTTFGLYVVASVTIATTISVFRGTYEGVTRAVLRSVGVRRRVLLVGMTEQVASLRTSLGSSRSGIDYEFVGHVTPGEGVRAALLADGLDELIVADDGLIEAELFEIVDAAHRAGVKVRVAPRTTELLIERGEYIPGQGVPLFELRPPVLAGADWLLKRLFDMVVAVAVVVVGLPFWLLIALLVKSTSRGPVFFSDRRIGLGEKQFRMLKFRTMVVGAETRQAALESENEATGALFKIRNDPRVTHVGRLLRRFSIDEIPNVINVLRGEMSLVGPRPLPIRDHDRLEPWHRRRSNVLPGMTGLWQIAGRSDLTFDDLVRLDFYYLENWSLWLDITILVKTLPAVAARRGAY